MKILFTAYEAAPMVKYGGLGDVVGSLPKALIKLDLDVRVALPGYPFIKRPDFLPGSSVPIFYIDSPQYFGSSDYEVYNSGLEGNRHRFAFFSQAVVGAFREWKFVPDVIHLHDWHTALIPSVLEVRSKQEHTYKKTATLLTLHNLAYHGQAGPHVLAAAHLDRDSLETITWDVDQWNPKGVYDVNLLAQGIMQADLINTVSPSYAEEIKTAEFGEGLEELIRAREARVYGILNGIDYEIWNPDRDSHIYDCYDIKSATVKKRVNKSRLLKELRLEDVTDRPLLAFIGRLAEQKGIDILLDALPGIIKARTSLVLLGTGNKKYEQSLTDLAQKWPQSIAVKLRFDEVLAHKIYAGADFVLIPSRFEPCGLVQMIAMRYGTIPVARAVGGLKDTIEDGKTGFLFAEYSARALLQVVRRALTAYQKPSRLPAQAGVGGGRNLPGGEWMEMVRRAMEQDFSWDRSALEYVKLYEKAVEYKKLKTKNS